MQNFRADLQTSRNHSSFFGISYGSACFPDVNPAALSKPVLAFHCCGKGETVRAIEMTFHSAVLLCLHSASGFEPIHGCPISLTLDQSLKCLRIRNRRNSFLTIFRLEVWRSISLRLNIPAPDLLLSSIGKLVFHVNACTECWCDLW